MVFNKKTYFISIFIFIIFSITVIFLNPKKINGKVVDNKYRVYTLERNSDLSFSGRVESKKRKNFYIDNDDLLIHINVKNGEYVKKGSPLFTYKKNDMIENMEEEGKQILSENYGLYFTVYAPFSAYVIVNKYNDDEPQIPLLQLYSKQKIVRSIISEFDYFKVHKNMLVDIQAISNNHRFKGIVQEIEEIPLDQKVYSDKSNDNIDAVSNYNFMVSINENILYGSNVKLTFKQNYIKIPSECFVSNDFEHIYLLDKGNVVVSKIEVEKEKDFYYTRDLSFSGKKVILNPNKMLTNGDKVDIND